MILNSMAGVTIMQKKSLPNADSLDKPISKEEVSRTIKTLKSGKSSGSDGILAEMLKSTGNTMTCFLTEYFNKIFKNGDYPYL